MGSEINCKALCGIDLVTLCGIDLVKAICGIDLDPRLARAVRRHGLGECGVNGLRNREMSPETVKPDGARHMGSAQLIALGFGFRREKGAREGRERATSEPALCGVMAYGECGVNGVGVCVRERERGERERERQTRGSTRPFPPTPPNIPGCVGGG